MGEGLKMYIWVDFVEESNALIDILEIWASQVAQWVKKPPAMQEPREPRAWSLGWEDPLEKKTPPHSRVLPGESHGQRKAWWTTVHRVAKSQTQLKQLSMHVRNLHDKAICVSFFVFFFFSTTHLSYMWMLWKPKILNLHGLLSSLMWSEYLFPSLSWF